MKKQRETKTVKIPDWIHKELSQLKIELSSGTLSDVIAYLLMEFEKNNEVLEK